MGRNSKGRSNKSPESCEFIIETVHTWGHAEVLAWINSFHLAEAAYRAAVTHYPNNKILMRHGMRIMHKHNFDLLSEWPAS